MKASTNPRIIFLALFNITLVLSITFICSSNLPAQKLNQPRTDKEQQIPTIRSKGGDGRNVDWVSIKRKYEKEYGSDEGNFYFSSDCSQGVGIVNSSSTLAPQKSKNYVVKNLSDQSPFTAWVEGKSDYGIGEWFKIKAAGVNVIYNGYQSSPLNWLNNSRVKKFKVYKNDNPLCFLELTDEMGAQRFELPGSEIIDYEKPSVFKFEIVDVYKGAKFSDVAISEIDWILCCFSLNTNILSLSGSDNISQISAGHKILNVDINSGETTETEILKTAKQTHLSLFKISTGTKQIEITPNHPLYIKNYGFIPLGKVLNNMGLYDFGELINKIEILTWDKHTNQLEFEKLEGIELIRGSFDTYTVLKLSKGDTYIANGFVTKVYSK